MTSRKPIFWSDWRQRCVVLGCVCRTGRCSTENQMWALQGLPGESGDDILRPCVFQIWLSSSHQDNKRTPCQEKNVSSSYSHGLLMRDWVNKVQWKERWEGKMRALPTRFRIVPIYGLSVGGLGWCFVSLLNLFPQSCWIVGEQWDVFMFNAHNWKITFIFIFQMVP